MMLTRLNRRIALLSAAVTMTVALSLTGCNLFGGAETTEATTKPVLTQSTWDSDFAAPTALQPVDRPVGQGPLPQFYLVESESTIRVTNVATSEEIATFPAKAGEIVSVERRGVFKAGKPVIGAQLAAGTYAIYKIYPDAGVIHAEQTRTMPTIPTTQPSEEADTPPADTPAPPSQ